MGYLFNRKVKKLEKDVERINRAHRYVMYGDTLSDALKRVMKEDASAAKQKRAVFFRDTWKYWVIGVVAFAVVGTVIVSVWLNPFGYTKEETVSSDSTLYENEAPIAETVNTDGLYEFEPVDNGRAYMLVKCNDPDITEVTIPQKFNGCPVTRIGKKAFYKNQKIEIVTLPDCVESIEAYAFLGCTNLRVVSMSEGIKSIGRYAFSDCVGLKNFTIPASVGRIEESAFLNCTGLTKIHLPEKMEYIGPYAFRNCESLIKVDIPRGIRKIEDFSFDCCGNLFEVNIPVGVEEIGYSAFGSCFCLREIELPGTMTTIGDCAFANGELVKINIPDSLTSIGGMAFSRWGFEAEDLVIEAPHSVEYYGYMLEEGVTWVVTE